MNFVKTFVGKQFPANFIRQVDYARSLGGLDHYCFGADFFYDKDMPIAFHPFIPFFSPRFGNASCYPDMLAYLNEVFTKQELEKIAYVNFGNFLTRVRAC